MAGYGNDADFAEWLSDNGHELPDAAPTPAVLRQRGSAYIDGLYGPRFSGTPTGGLEQERAWPRTDASAFGSYIGTDVVPAAVIQASYAAALHEAQNPGGLAASTSAEGRVKRKKIDVLEKEYFEGSGDNLKDATVRLAAVEGLLAPFFSSPEIAVFVV